MTTQVAKTPQKDRTNLIQTLQNSLYPGSKSESVEMVLSYCEQAGLDVMQKPVHIVPMPIKNPNTGKYDFVDTVMPGIGLYRIQASRSYGFAGITEPTFGEDVTEQLDGTTVTYPRFCKVTVKRQLPNGTIADFTAMELWKENYATQNKNTSRPNSMWLKRSYGQLAKCTEAQALRKAFPEVGQAPTAEEMEGKQIYDNSEPHHPGQIEANPEPKQLPEYTEERFMENMQAWQQAIQSGKTTPQRLVEKVEAKYTLPESIKQSILNLDVAEAEYTEAQA